MLVKKNANKISNEIYLSGKLLSNIQFKILCLLYQIKTDCKFFLIKKY